jgi:hypothetical protein
MYYNEKKLDLFPGIMIVMLLSSLAFASCFLQSQQLTMAKTANVTNTIDNNATTTNFLIYQNSTYGVAIQYPPDWTYIGHDTTLQPVTQPIVTFTPLDPLDSTLVRIFVTPLSAQEEGQKPTLSQVAERTIELDQQTLSGFILNESRPITLADGTTAHKLSYNYTDPEYGFTGAQDITFIQDNNLYLIEYFAEPQLYANHLPKFQTMLDSLEVLPQ